jgi:hypothetical protein
LYNFLDALLILFSFYFLSFLLWFVGWFSAWFDALWFFPPLFCNISMFCFSSFLFMVYILMPFCFAHLYNYLHVCLWFYPKDFCLVFSFYLFLGWF